MKFGLGNDSGTKNVNIGDEIILDLGNEKIQGLDKYNIIFDDEGWLTLSLNEGTAEISEGNYENMFIIEDQFYEFDLDDFRNTKKLKVTSEYISKNRCVIKIYFEKAGEYIPFMKIHVTLENEDVNGFLRSFLNIEYNCVCDCQCCYGGRTILDIGFNF